MKLKKERVAITYTLTLSEEDAQWLTSNLLDARYRLGNFGNYGALDSLLKKLLHRTEL